MTEKIMTSILALAIPFFLFAQAHDMMKISIKDSVTTYNDCVLKVEISKKSIGVNENTRNNLQKERS